MEKEIANSEKILDRQVLRRLIGFVKPFKGPFVFLVFLTILLALITPIRPILVQQTIDKELGSGNFDGILFMIYLLVGHLILQAIVQYGHTYLSGWLGQHIVKDIRIQLFRHVQRMRLSFFDKTPIGRLVTRNVSDIETLAEVFSQGLAAMIGDILQILIILGFMFWMNWQLTLFSLIPLPLLLIATYIFKERVKVAFNEVRTAVSNLNTFVQEHITGMNIVQIFNSEKREFKKFQDINREHLRANLKSVMYYSVYFPVAEIIQAVGIGLIVWYGSSAMLGQDALQMGQLIAFIMFLQMFFRPIRMIADRFNTLQMGIVSTNRIVKLLDDNDYLPNEGTVKPEQIKGDVSFENVWFAYKGDDWVLKNISFDLSAGQTLALVGATGAGKTSVINLLSRFYEINEGHIFIDGRDVRDYELTALRSKIAVVLQDVFLFSDTIYNNITLRNDEISREKVKAASDMVGATPFIERLPGGFEYNVQERGATLSVGQRQLISFVRALVYDPAIIVLDEATSSVDTETEELIQRAIEQLMQGRTSIVIAHRLSTIQSADQILVLDKGEILERGNHSDLLEKGGAYAELYEMQYKEIA